jgi:hypothetical protein
MLSNLMRVYELLAIFGIRLELLLFGTTQENFEKIRAIVVDNQTEQLVNA